MNKTGSEKTESYKKELENIWKNEEKLAHIHGWDFSHIHGRYEEENDLPWDYEKIVRQYLNDDINILDYDTGGGEFLLSLKHPFNKTAATEGYPPNVELCKQTLLPLGIDFRECDDPADIPFQDESFDLIINRHGDFNPKELYRLLKKGGVFITEQVGAFVWFAHIIEWEFPGFSVDRCFEQLLKMQKRIENEGKVEGTVHRYLIIAEK